MDHLHRPHSHVFDEAGWMDVTPCSRPLHVQTTCVRSVNEAIIAGLRELTDDEIAGNLAAIEPGRVRLRRQR